MVEASAFAGISFEAHLMLSGYGEILKHSALAVEVDVLKVESTGVRVDASYFEHDCYGPLIKAEDEKIRVTCRVRTVEKNTSGLTIKPGSELVFDFRQRVQKKREPAAVVGAPLTIAVLPFHIEKAKDKTEIYPTFVFHGEVRRGPPLRQVMVPDTNYCLAVADMKPGEGREIQRKGSVRIRYRFFVNDYFNKPLPGTKEQTSDLKFGTGQMGQGLETALVGMKAGGVRQVCIREEVAKGIRENVPGRKGDTLLRAEIEILSVKPE